MTSDTNSLSVVICCNPGVFFFLFRIISSSVHRAYSRHVRPTQCAIVVLTGGWRRSCSSSVAFVPRSPWAAASSWWLWRCSWWCAWSSAFSRSSVDTTTDARTRKRRWIFVWGGMEKQRGVSQPLTPSADPIGPLRLHESMTQTLEGQRQFRRPRGPGCVEHIPAKHIWIRKWSA